MNRPTLGQRCTLTGYASKHQSIDPTKAKREYPFNTWWQRFTQTQPIQATYIGYRVVHEGITELEVDGDGEWHTWSYPVFNRLCSKVVWVFVANEKSSPFYAFPEDVSFSHE